MSRLALLLLFYCLGLVVAPAQTPTTVDFTLPAAPTPAELATHTLTWIKTGNAFAQEGLDAAAIDREIERRIRLYGRETPIVTFDVPLNSKRLVPPAGKKPYASYHPSIGVLNDQPLKAEAYFWQYRDVDIAVLGDGYAEQLHVYAVARALEILRCRYPRAYQRLFVESREFAQSVPPTAGFINRFNQVLVSFNDVTRAPIAESGTVLHNDNVAGSYAKYSNLAVLSFHAANLRGHSGNGSSVLYHKSADENYLRYLREGLVETLVHEMLHRYIETRRNLDPLATTVTAARPTQNSPARALNLLWEEVFINNTSLGYFVREGGLQPPLLYYYRGILDNNIAALHALRLAAVEDDMSRLSGFTGSNYLSLMRFDYLD